TGYSSMSYLKRFPVDVIKIDRVFIADIATGSRDIAITESLIRMAHALNLKAVAEGVETVEQMELLKSLGCDEAQGFYFAPPLEPGAVVQFFQRAMVLA